MQAMMLLSNLEIDAFEKEKRELPCLTRKQEIWLIRPQDELAASIWHDTHPDDYDDEDWLEYVEWLARNDEQLPPC